MLFLSAPGLLSSSPFETIRKHIHTAPLAATAGRLPGPSWVRTRSFRECKGNADLFVWAVVDEESQKWTENLQRVATISMEAARGSSPWLWWESHHSAVWHTSAQPCSARM